MGVNAAKDDLMGSVVKTLKGELFEVVEGLWCGDCGFFVGVPLYDGCARHRCLAQERLDHRNVVFRRVFDEKGQKT